MMLKAKKLIRNIECLDDTYCDYVIIKGGTYYSKRYNKHITVEKYMPSDGATGAFDVCIDAWGFHDKLCYTGKFDDGTLCSNWQASCIVSDILSERGRWFRSTTWKYATLIGGGGKCRENGIFYTGQ